MLVVICLECVCERWYDNFLGGVDWHVEERRIDPATYNARANGHKPLLYESTQDY